MLSHLLQATRTRALVLLPLVALAVAACGGGGGGGMSPDTTAPTVSVNAPPATVSRTYTLKVTVGDNRGVATVDFLVDNTAIGSRSAAPFELAWNTATVADGAHSVTARATDTAGNVTMSSAVSYIVKNSVAFSPKLSPAQEFPAAGSDASGDATLTVNVGTGVVSGSVTLSGMTPTAAHIHEGYAGVGGPVLVTLSARNGSPGVFDVPAGTTLTPGQVDELLAGALYLNAHSGGFPSGEVRGQITPDNVSVFFTDLDDRQVTGVGDDGGRARAALTVNRDTRAAVAHVWLERPATARAVHLNLGFAGTVGTASLNLAPDGADPAHWSATSTGLDQATLTAVLDGGAYFSVDSDAKPTGAIRGQVVPSGVTVAYARLEGLQEVPAVASSAVGRGAVTIDPAGAVKIHLMTTGLTAPVAAHLHAGYGGTNGPILIGLTQDGSNPAHWSSSAGTTLSPADLAALRAGGTYLNVHTQASQGGEIRGQVVPAGVRFIVSRLTGAEEVPAKTTAGQGTVAVTARTDTGDLVIHANTSGVDDAVGAHMHYAFAGANGPVAVGLTKDVADPKHWSVSGVQLTADELDDLEQGEMYVNVHTPANPGGEIRGQLVPDEVRVVFSDMSGGEEVPAHATPATGLAATTVNLSRNMVAINVHAVGVDDAVASHIHSAARGSNGPVLFPLAQDAADAGHWSAVDQPVTAAAIDDFLVGRWYVNVHTPANPNGEIRGQIGAPPPPSADTTPPTVVLTAPPATVSGMIALAATAQDDVGVTSVRFIANGNLIGTSVNAPYGVSWDTATVPNGQVTLTVEARDAAGNVGSSAPVTVTVSNAAAVTLTQLQNSIFTLKCSGCHSGGGGSLPSSMNLSSRAATFAALVDVASEEQPALKRVNPGDAAGSYVVRKLEGTAGISGVRMPQGGPFLSASDIDLVKQWINAGAPNN